jgi:hypothetical protein
LHFVSESLERAAEKVLAVRSDWARRNPELLARLLKTHAAAAAYVDDSANREDVCCILAAPNRLVVAHEVIRRTLDGCLKVSPSGVLRMGELFDRPARGGAARPATSRLALCAMVRWGQEPMSQDLLEAALGVFRPDLYDDVVGASCGGAAGSQFRSPTAMFPPAALRYRAEQGRERSRPRLADPWAMTVFYMGARAFSANLPRLLAAGLDPVRPPSRLAARRPREAGTCCAGCASSSTRSQGSTQRSPALS